MVDEADEAVRKVPSPQVLLHWFHVSALVIAAVSTFFIISLFFQEPPVAGVNMECKDGELAEEYRNVLPADHCARRPRQFTKFIWLLIDSLPTKETYELTHDSKLNRATVYALRREPDTQYTYQLLPSLFDGHYPNIFRAGEILSDNLIDQWGKAANEQLWLVGWPGEIPWNTFTGNGGREGGFAKRFQTRAYDEYPTAARLWDSNLLDDLAAANASLLYYTFALDHAFHAYKTSNPEQKVQEFKGKLPILIDWLDKHPEYLLIVNSDHGRKREDHDPLHGMPGGCRKGEKSCWSTPGNDGVQLLYARDLPPHAGSGDSPGFGSFMDYPIIQNVESCSTLARYLYGINIPFQNIGQVAYHEVEELKDFYALYVNCLQLTWYLQTQQKVDEKKCLGGIALEDFGPSKAPPDVDKWIQDVRPHVSWLADEALKIQRDAAWMSPAIKGFLKFFLCPFLVILSLSLYLLSARPWVSVWQQVSERSLWRKIVSICLHLYTMYIGLKFISTCPLIFLAEKKTKGGELDFDDSRALISTLCWGFLAAAITQGVAQRDSSRQWPQLIWGEVVVFELHKSCLCFLFAGVVDYAWMRTTDHVNNWLWTDIRFYKHDAIPHRTFAILFAIPSYLLYMHIVHKPGEDDQISGWKLQDVLSTKRRWKMIRLAFLISMLFISDISAYIDSNVEGEAGQRTKPGSTIWFFRIFLLLWFGHIVHCFSVPSLRTELPFAFMLINAAFSRTFQRRTGLLLFSLPAMTFFAEGTKAANSLYTIFLVFNHAYFSYRQLGHRWDTDADVEVSLVAQYDTSPIRTFQLLALLMERAGLFFAAISFFIQDAPETHWTDGAGKIHSWFTAALSFNMARTGLAAAACGTWITRGIVEQRSGFLLVLQGTSMLGYFCFASSLIWLSSWLKARYGGSGERASSVDLERSLSRGVELASFGTPSHANSKVESQPLRKSDGSEASVRL